MVKLNKIYTRTGDKGTTGLGTGERVAKHALRIAAYGTVDEANATIGVARLHIPADYARVDQMLLRIQNDMFDLGADLCVPDRGEKLPYEPLRIAAAQVTRLEAEIDELNAELSRCARSSCRAARPRRRISTSPARSRAAPSG